MTDTTKPDRFDEVAGGNDVKMRVKMMSPARSIALWGIVTETAARFGVTVADIRSRRRTDAICDARMTIGYVAHGLGFSYPQIGRATGKHHATFVLSSRKIRNIGKRCLEVEI